MWKKCFLALISITLVGLGYRTAYSQLINRGLKSYINYGWTDFQNYPENQPVFPKFDYLGNFLLKGFDVFTWEEYRTLSPNEGSVIVKGRMFQDWLRRLVIANDTFGGVGVRFAIGGGMRTTFTPLTLDLTRLNGVRFDLASDRHQFTAIYSRVSDPLKLDYKQSFSKDWVVRKNEGVFLLGGHWESKFLRDHFTIGATFVNMYRFDSLLKLRDNSLRGVAIRNAIPDTIVVRFTDDSPEDGIGGAAVYNICAVAQVQTGDKVISMRIEPEKILKSPGVITHRNYLEASGQYHVGILEVPVSITYYFPMPKNTVQVEFKALVANDYRISIRQSHHFTIIEGSKEKTVTVSEVPLRGEWPYYPFFVIRRAKGNVRDMSNKGFVRFSYGMLTGLTTMGLNMELNLIGFHLKGEYNRNFCYFQYPVKKGDRSKWTDAAYFLTVTKDINPFMVGAEIFSIGSKYNTYHPNGPFWYFNDERQIPWQYRGITGYNNRYPLVDDNDDNDIWPDNWVDEWNIYTPDSFIRQDAAGIFPGLDKNKDQFPDYNVNNNNIPDWDEPFLQYFVDPVEFQYGADYNNNFIVDAFEDDLLPQYPYYKDEKGQHFFVTFRPLSYLKFTTGSVNIHQIAGGGINKMTYGTINIDYRVRGRGKIWFEHKVKRVRDNIPNDWWEFVLQEGGGAVGRANYIHTRFRDRLVMKNSLVHRGYLEVKYHPIRDLNIINSVRYEFNSMLASEFSDGTSQPEDKIDFIGLVCKADYKFQYKNFTIMPRIKNYWYRWSRKSLNKPYVNKNVLIPILRADYRVTRNTFIKLGMQGFPLLKNRVWNWVNKDYSYKEQDFIILVNNITYYQGYKVAWEIGWQHTYRDYEGPGLGDDNFSKFFIRVHSGVSAIY